MKHLLKLVIAAALVIGVQPGAAHADQSIPYRPGDTGTEVIKVQYILRAFGYVLPVDGAYSATTAKAVAKWQRANGLRVDGVVGPYTLWSIMSAANAAAPAARVAPPAAPSPAGPGGPYAPAGADECAEMTFYRIQAGLPSRFDQLGWRESNCKNTVTSNTGCCVGYWQIHTGNFTAPGYRAGFVACGVTRRSDIIGLDPAVKQRQACAAKVMYDVSGYQPWAL